MLHLKHHLQAVDALDWEALYCELRPRIFKFFLYRLGDTEISQDLTSATFVKAWKARHQYRCDVGAFENWLFRIAHNVVIDYLRQIYRHRALSLEAVHTLHSEINMESATQKQFHLVLLSKLLETLSEREREILTLKFEFNLTNKHISQRLGLGESNVSTIIYRVLRKLRQRWIALNEGIQCID